MMILGLGERNFGKVDQVGDFCYVATRFFHLWFIPLVPVQSFIIFAGTESTDGRKKNSIAGMAGMIFGVAVDEESFKGVPIRFSRKSILFGWLRAALFLAAPIAFVLAFVRTAEALNDGSNAFVISALFLWLVQFGFVATLLLTYRLSGSGPLINHQSFPGLRTALCIATAIAFVMALLRTDAALSARPNAIWIDALARWSALVGLIATLVLSYRLSRCGLNRAMQLADQLGVSRLAVAKVIHPDRTDEELLTQIGEDDVQSRSRPDP